MPTEDETQKAIPRRRPRLTARRVSVAPPAPAGQGYYLLRDGELLGFCVRITERGVKTFVLETKIYGKIKRIFIERWPGMTVEAARKRAYELRAAVRAGQDPTAKPKHPGLTLGELRDVFYEQHARLKRRSWPQDERRINVHFGDLLTHPLEALSVDLLTRRHMQIGEHSGPIEANRAIELLKAMFARAIRWEMFHLPNPAAKVERFPETARRRYLSPAELDRVLDALEGEGDPFWKAYFKLLLFIGCRRSELLGSKWEDVDTEQRTITFRDTKTATIDTKPIGPEALGILLALPSHGSSEWLFPSHAASGHLEEPKKAWRRIRKAAGVPDVTTHDLRRTFATTLAGMGYSLHLISRSLGHRSLASAKPYAHLDDAEARRAREALEEHLRDRRAALPAPTEDDPEE